MIIDILESVTDIQEALMKTFGLTKEFLESDEGKQMIAHVARIYVQHDYLGWLTNKSIELSTLAARIASVFYKYKCTDAYVKCKAISEAIIHIEGFSVEDDAPQEYLGLQYELEDFIEHAFCEDDSLTSPIMGELASREVVCQIVMATGKEAKNNFLIARVVICLSSAVRSCFKSTAEYNEMIRSIVLAD